MRKGMEQISAPKRFWITPYAFFAPKTAARGRLRYVPASLAGVVRRYLRNGEEIEQLVAEISAINAELLARRELS